MGRDAAGEDKNINLYDKLQVKLVQVNAFVKFFPQEVFVHNFSICLTLN